jgi:formylglycine-generating enzyme required for sulfatase activity
MMSIAGTFASALMAQAPPVQCTGKLSESQVEKLLSAGVSQGRVEQYVRTCGIAFEVTWRAAARLQRAGASGALIGVLRGVQPKRPDPLAKREAPPATKPATPTEKPSENAVPPSAPPKETARPPLEQPREPAPLTTGSKRVNPKDGLTYVWIAPGTFTMGCSPGDSGCYDYEKPPHLVTITKGFWIGQTEVTQAAYERVIGSNPSHSKGTSLPVETISWDEAGAYCKAVGMRLPTEAEWEYAARGGNPAARYGKLDEIAWYKRNSGSTTHEVQQKRANGYGLNDTLGNVWEWVGDWYDEKYYASSPAIDPKGPSSGTLRTLRGGSSGVSSRNARVSNRDGVVPGFPYVSFGVRCAGD